MANIVFNGKSYASIDEMPPEERKVYEQVVGMFADKNQDGVPDVFEGARGIGEVNVHSVSISSDQAQIVVDGKAYSSADDMPADVRQNYNQAMAEIKQVLKDANQNDVPDILEGIVPDRSKPSPSPAMPQPDPATMHPRPGATPHVVTDTPPRAGLLLIGGVIVILIAVIVAYVVLMVFQQG